MPAEKLFAVIVAGGSGTRMGSDIPKQFLPVGGRPILVHTVKKFLSYQENLLIKLVLPAAGMTYWENHCKQYFSHTETGRIQLVEGGSSRIASVENGLSAISQVDGHTWVAIHDGVRAFVNHEMIQSSFDIAREKGAAVCCVPVKSSIRETSSSGKSKAVDRSRFLHVQTPQTFSLSKIKQAYVSRPHDDFTDDASIYEAVVGPVSISQGSYDNIKITTPEDMFVAEALMKKERNHLTAGLRSKIKLLLLDIDGTMTDGGIFYGEGGEVFKRFDVKDGMAIHRLQSRYGLKVGFISSGATGTIIENRAKKLKMDLWHYGPEPKTNIIEGWLGKLGINWDEIAYIGDDLNDMEVIKKVGISASPSDAVREIREAVDQVLELPGGGGCVREFIENILGYDLNVANPQPDHQ
ncbi:MAG: 2-C-methyl-D-erythritol 4-phosphate cytidylyltransferase [Bacteroidota bacterium]